MKKCLSTNHRRRVIVSISLSCMYALMARRTVSAWLPQAAKLRPRIQVVIHSPLRSLSDAENGSPTGKQPTRKRPSNGKKFRVVDKIEKHHLNKLAQAFDELAQKEGLGASGAYFADDATFEDDFGYVDDDDDEDYENGGKDGRVDVRDLQTKSVAQQSSNDYDMEKRIANASNDLNFGRVSVSPELDDFAKSVTAADLRKLGFRPEKNPFGNDETPRRDQFRLVTNEMTCPGCGSDFQCRDEKLPGYLPPEKYELQRDLIELTKNAETLRLKSETTEWSPEDEVKWLIQTASSKVVPEVGADSADVDDELDHELIEASRDVIICKRCHGLQYQGKVDSNLRPGWTTEPMLSQESFRDLLKPLHLKPAVIIALVDLFDFAGSILPELDMVAGTNPVIVAANKVDLLPASMGSARVENWVRRELEYLGVKSLANIGGAVRLISCRTGSGVNELMAKARSLADERNCDIYVVGAANAGKSTLLNRLLPPDTKENRLAKPRKGNKAVKEGQVTTSPLPGTTLKFIKLDLGNGRSLYDTPGLLVPGTLTQLLTPEELKIAIPKARVEAITFRVLPGKCVLVGGLARIELLENSRPFFFTFYVANGVKLHPTDSSRADEFVAKHVGEMILPPLPPGRERLEEIGEFEEHVVDIEGVGWKEAAADISLMGLGWVAVTGSGKATVKVSVPRGIGVSVRPPLMPFDIMESTAKYTGSRAVRKSSGKRGRGVGRK